MNGSSFDPSRKKPSLVAQALMQQSTYAPTQDGGEATADVSLSQAPRPLKPPLPPGSYQRRGYTYQ